MPKRRYNAADARHFGLAQFCRKGLVRTPTTGGVSQQNPTTAKGLLFRSACYNVHVRLMEINSFLLVTNTIFNFRVIFGTLIFLSAICTSVNVIRKQLYDQFLKKGSGKNSRECLDVEKVKSRRPHKPLYDKFLTCFQLHENARIIFSTYLAPSSLAAIHGVRLVFY